MFVRWVIARLGAQSFLLVQVKDTHYNYVANMNFSVFEDKGPIHDALRKMFGWDTPEQRINTILVLQVCLATP